MNVIQRKETSTSPPKIPITPINGIGIGSNIIQRYIKISTFWLNTMAECQRIVWHIHTPLHYESRSKCMKPSMAKPTFKGGQDVKSLVPSCTITISSEGCVGQTLPFSDCMSPTMFCLFSDWFLKTLAPCVSIAGKLP